VSRRSIKEIVIFEMVACFCSGKQQFRFSAFLVWKELCRSFSMQQQSWWINLRKKHSQMHWKCLAQHSGPIRNWIRISVQSPIFVPDFTQGFSYSGFYSGFTSVTQDNVQDFTQDFTQDFNQDFIQDLPQDFPQDVTQDFTQYFT
jgi:hypothetical protein